MSNVLQDQEKIVKIIAIFFPKAKVYLFGSRARGQATERSDIDIAIDNGHPLPLTEHGQIMAMVDALNIPQKVDILDFFVLPEEMKNRILREGKVWKE